jgi:hypothetical protein
MQIIHDVFNEEELKSVLDELQVKLVNDTWTNQKIDYSPKHHTIGSLYKEYDDLVLYAPVSKTIKTLIRKKLISYNHDLRFYDFLAAFNHWKIGSSAPMHYDSHSSFSATFYLTKDWHYEYGGYLLWQDGEHTLKGFIPKLNTCALNTEKCLHGITTVTSKAPTDRFTIQVFGK